MYPHGYVFGSVVVSYLGVFFVRVYRVGHNWFSSAVWPAYSATGARPGVLQAYDLSQYVQQSEGTGAPGIARKPIRCCRNPRTVV